MALNFEMYKNCMLDLILPSSDLIKVHDGMLWCEGPVYFPAGDYFLWSDIPNNRLYQWPTDSTVRILQYDSNYTNGNNRDNAGRLVSCRHLTRSVVRTEVDGSETVLADSFDDKPLNSPNDVIVASDGTVWFTDPTYGIMTNYEGRRATPEQPVCGVYKISADGEHIALASSNFEKPNGLALSRDESILYVADSARSHNPDGNHHVFACELKHGCIGDVQPIFAVEHGVPDGLRVDEFGNIWCSSARGVEIHNSTGEHIGCILIPEAVSNLEFGGPKGNRLLITASKSVYAVYVAVSGSRFI
jgi:gluconolactonase